jgi:hypothetical protein
MPLENIDQIVFAWFVEEALRTPEAFLDAVEAVAGALDEPVHEVVIHGPGQQIVGAVSECRGLLEELDEPLSATARFGEPRAPATSTMSLHFGTGLLSIAARGSFLAGWPATRQLVERALPRHVSAEVEDTPSLRRLIDDLQQQRRQFQAGLESAKQRLESLSNAYQEKLAFDSAVDYWEDKARSHRQNADGRRRRAIGVGIVGLVFFALIMYLLFENYGQETPPYWLLVAFLIVVGGLVWVERMVLRTYTSALHLAEVAASKKVMTQVYLALMLEGKLDREDRKLVLEPMFRPASIGLLGGEESTGSLYELATMFMTYKS